MDTSATHPVARVEHPCWLCGGTIPVGLKYVRVACFDEGTAHTVCSHPWCSQASEAIDWFDEYNSAQEDHDEFRRMVVERGIVPDEGFDRWCQTGEGADPEKMHKPTHAPQPCTGSRVC